MVLAAPLEIWVADANSGSIIHGGHSLSCSSKSFDEFVCMPADDFECFYSVYVLKQPCGGETK